MLRFEHGVNGNPSLERTNREERRGIDCLTSIPEERHRICIVLTCKDRSRHFERLDQQRCVRIITTAKTIKLTGESDFPQGLVGIVRHNDVHIDLFAVIIHLQKRGKNQSRTTREEEETSLSNVHSKCSGAGDMRKSF